VNDIAWAERPSLIDAGRSDRVYTLRVGDDGKTAVQMGDGQRGARLPTGRENVVATYRRGIGAAGNVATGKLSQLMTRPLGLKSATNPAAAEGGIDPDDAESARRNMPLGVRTLGRAVSLRDYEDFARAFTGIAKAHAAVLTLKAGRTIFITVAGEDGAKLSPTNPVLVRLLEALRQSGDPLVRFEVQPYRDVTFALGLRVKRDETYTREAVVAAVERALHDAFSFDAREFGQSVALSEVIAVADGVPGVIAVDVEHFYRGATKTRETRLVAEQPRADAAGNGLAAELLTLVPGSLEWLGEMP
jgi:predicted phage baseplate assembly protein